MAGTLSAVLNIGRALDAQLAGGGALTNAAFPKYATAAALTGAGGLDASVRPRFIRAAALAGLGAYTASIAQKYSPTVPLTASGTLSAAAVSAKLHLADDFNRANNSSSLGANWTNRLGTVGINSNTAYTTGSFASGIATHNITMPSDNMSVSMVVTDKTFAPGLILGANTSGESVLLTVSSGSPSLQLWRKTGWTPSTAVGTTANPALSSTDVITLRRIGNVYTALVNDVATACTWTDGSNVVPRNSSHRLVGLYVSTNGSGDSGRINSWSADEL